MMGCSLALLAAWVISGGALARQETSGETPAGLPGETPAASLAPATSASQGEIDIVCDAFGVGEVARPGAWAGVRLRLTDRASKPRGIAVCFWQPDSDGDTALATREVTLNPGVAQTLWLYAPLGWRESTSSVFAVTAHALGVESAAPAEQTDTGGAPSLGRQVASARIAPKRMVKPADSMIGVIGRSPAGGLVRYAVTLDASDPRPVSSNELSEIITGLTPTDIPDRWMGLSQYESLVWLSGDPGSLSEPQADAIEEWVRRGGHFVVSLPSVGQAWTNPRTNPLQALLPRVTIAREEGVSLEPLRALLRPRDQLPMPDRFVVHTLSPDPSAEIGEAAVILAAPDGRPIVVRRAMGAGMVTLIGLDFAQQSLAERVDTQLFWHRVLGKRFDALAREQMERVRATRGFLSPDQAWLDADIPGEIAKSGRAGVGVLLGLGVFASYLLLAGPLGFAMLKRRGAVQHAWVAFVAVAAGFSVVAWGGARATRPMRAEIQHLTVLDHVYGQPVERARSWFSALLPTYGEQRVSIDAAAGGWGASVHDALRPWDSPLAVSDARFPDARPYALDARNPSSLQVPTRSTVKIFQADWLGAPAWAGVAPEGGEIRLDEAAGGSQLVGRLSHRLPAPLKDVQIMLVRGQKPLSGELGDNGPLLAIGSAWALGGEWAPGDIQDLREISAATGSTIDSTIDRLSSDLTRSLINTLTGAPEVGGRVDVASRLRGLTFFAALRQPNYLATDQNPPPAPARRATHGLDLSPWLTQPCLIITGQVERAACPIPLRIDGAEVPSVGRTFVRWVYPLPSKPPAPVGR